MFLALFYIFIFGISKVRQESLARDDWRKSNVWALVVPG